MFIDKQEIIEAYDAVRADDSDTIWAAFTYDGKNIVLAGSGTDYEELINLAQTNGDRVFCYVRVTMGDELSIRQKFVFIQYMGENATPMGRAKCSTDKAVLKTILKEFAKEYTFDQTDGMPTFEKLKSDLRKSGGANYDAQAN